MMGTMRKVTAVGWLVAATLCALGAGSCTGSDEDVPARFAEECDNDCAEGLECINRVCTARCAAMTDCTPHHASAICDANYCYLPCMTSFNCPNGLACTQLQSSARMTCRAQP
jgi:hypothetical protein